MARNVGVAGQQDAGKPQPTPRLTMAQGTAVLDVAMRVSAGAATGTIAGIVIALLVPMNAMTATLFPVGFAVAGGIFGAFARGIVSIFSYRRQGRR